jgi:hypothetical protein
MKKILFFSFGLLMAFQACEKEVVPPDNPFDAIDRGQTVNPVDTLNPASITGIHRNILFPKCAVPGCHDGSFEPDFRSVQSSFHTLVYAPVTKNNLSNSFRYRVIPGDTSMSVLYERITNCCFVNENDRMPQDNIGTKLPDTDLNHIASWIMAGAKDANGITHQRPNLPPAVPFYAAVSTNFTTEYSIASNRQDGQLFNPFRLPSTAGIFYVAAVVQDDETPISQLQYNKLVLSNSIDDFSNGTEIQATYLNVPNEGEIWLASLDASNFEIGDTVYMRYRVKDLPNADLTEFPNQQTLVYFKTYWSFVVVP